MSEPTVNFSVQTRQVQFVVPAELIKKNFKTIQKLVEKLKKLVSEEILSIKKNPNLTRAEKLLIVRKLIRSFESYQKKLALAIEHDEDYRTRLTTRSKHISALKNFTLDHVSSNSDEKHIDTDDKLLDLHDEKLVSWYRGETNLLIIDYLLKSNTRKDKNIGSELMRNLAPSFEYDITKLVDHDVYESFNKVFLSINMDHDLEAIAAWYNDNKNALKKLSSNLQFEIHYCKFLSMIESGEALEAISYCKTYLAPYGNIKNYLGDDLVNFEKNHKRLTKVGAPLVYVSMCLDAFSSETNGPGKELSTRYSKYNAVMSEERWRGLSKCFTEDFTKIYGIPKTYPLLVLLSAGLSSLKTKSCYCNEENTIFKTQKRETLEISSWKDLSLRGPNYYYKLLKKINQCPVCSPELFRLSLNLPYAQLLTSILNNPFKLPNGNIYPFEKLLNPSKKMLAATGTLGLDLVRNNQLMDPLTREVFLIEDCVRVFPA